MVSLEILPVYLADSMALGQQARWHRLVSNMQKTFREKDCLVRMTIGEKISLAALLRSYF